VAGRVIHSQIPAYWPGAFGPTSETCGYANLRAHSGI
jgi:hypothetical protein